MTVTYTLQGKEASAMRDIMGVLGYYDDTSSFYKFNVTQTATTAGAAIRVGLKVFVPNGQDRESVSNKIKDKLKNFKPPYRLHNEGKNPNQINVVIPNTGIRPKIIRLDIKPVSSPRGAKETEIGESAQCVYCRLRFMQTAPLIETNISQEAIEAAYKSNYVQVSATLDSILQLGVDWKRSCILGANGLYDKKSVMWNGTPSSYTFYRGIGLDADMAQAFKKIKGRLEKQGEEDKWNPADIWMGSGKVTSNHIQAASLSGDPKNLNSYLISWYLGGDLIGISLKKMENRVKVSQVNLIGGKSRRALMNDKGKFNPTPTNWIDMSATAAGGAFRYGSGSDQKVTLRNFGGAKSANFQGEAKGVGAMGGKINPSVMEGLIKLKGFNPQFNLPNNQTIWNNSDPVAGGGKEAEELAREIVRLLKLFGTPLTKLGTDPVDAIMGKTWETKPEKKTAVEVRKYIYSKYMTVKLLEGLHGISNAKKRQECITDIYLYSNSQWTDSGFHLKLSEA